MKKKATTWRQAQKEARKKEAATAYDLHSDICNDCLLAMAKSGQRIESTAIFERPMECGHAAYDLWLTNDGCRVVPLAGELDRFEGEFLADAVLAFLNTPEGQRKAVQFVAIRAKQLVGEVA